MSKYSNISTHIISGFLGAGKTTAIKHLLSKKSEAERWAVIVNEFGKVGIDGTLLKNDAVEIREIAGGCLCCVSSQLLSVGLNQIIKTVNPHRILIEPTGLGHPQKLIDFLTGEYYQSVLNLKAVINLLDARQLKDSRYTEHKAFVDQVQLADILIANKADLYTEEDRLMFYQYAASFLPAIDRLFMVSRGRLELEWLEYPHSTERRSQFPKAHQHISADKNTDDVSVQENRSGWTMVQGGAEDYLSIGWVIKAESVFSEQRLLAWLEKINQSCKIERIKGVMHTESGWILINITRTEREILPCEENTLSIVEVVFFESVLSEQFDTQLKECLVF